MAAAKVTPAPPDNASPLCVDLDGTLIKTDLLWESLVRLLRRNPLWLFPVVVWWLRGRAFLKRQIAARVTLDYATIPFNAAFLDFLRREKQSGRKLILATASDGEPARGLAAHVGLFDEVLASDGRNNLRGPTKLRTLRERYGEHGFDYAGNSSVDLGVWLGTRKAIVVNAGPGLARRAARCAQLGPVFPKTGSTFAALVRALRPQRWLKNLIVFVPVIASQQWTFWPLLAGFSAFGVFSLCASGVYVLNGLMNLDEERRHSSKRQRPFAAGDLPLAAGLILSPALLAMSLIVAWQLTGGLAALLAVYVVTAVVHSRWPKCAALLDVLLRAGLYLLRVLAGYIVTGMNFSPGLLVAAAAVFLGLAWWERRRAATTALPSANA